MRRQRRESNNKKSSIGCIISSFTSLLLLESLICCMSSSHSTARPTFTISSIWQRLNYTHLLMLNQRCCTFSSNDQRDKQRMNNMMKPTLKSQLVWENLTEYWDCRSRVSIEIDCFCHPCASSSLLCIFLHNESHNQLTISINLSAIESLQHHWING